jgi:hypothetical protein
LGEEAEVSFKRDRKEQLDWMTKERMLSERRDILTTIHSFMKWISMLTAIHFVQITYTTETQTKDCQPTWFLSLKKPKN